MSANSILADTSVVISIATAAIVFIRGWRRRIQDAARRPFLSGHAAIEEAETALQWKDRRLSELTESEATLKTNLAGAIATSAAQQEQITKLQARLYQIEAENRDLAASKEEAERRDRQNRDRIGSLETIVEDLQRKLALHNPPY